MQKYFLQFNKYKPEFFTAYPASMTFFAEFIQKYDLNIHSIYYDPISDKFNSGSVYRDLKEGG